MKLFTLLAFCFALLFAPVAWGAGEDCTMATGDQTWSAIDTITDDCTDKGGQPDGDDHIVCGDGTNLIFGGDITYDTDGSSLELQSGCVASIDIPTLEKVITVHFMDGQDGISVGGSSYDSVALWEEAGATLDVQSAYLTNGLETPLWQTEVASDKKTIWTLDQVSACDLGGADTAVESGIGGAGDCATGTEEYGFSLVYTNPRNNPQDGNTGENYLHESIGELTAKMLVCFTSGMDRNSCYSIGALDQTGDQYAISLRILQLIQADEAAIDYVAFTKAKRQQVLVDPMNAASKGDKCVDFDDTVAVDAIAAKGDYVGACAYFYDSSGVNGWPRPMPIARTLESVDCDGAAGDDSIWFPDGIPFDLAANSKMVISPTCFGQGDKFYVMAAPVFEVEDGNGEWTLGDGKFLFEGTNPILGLVIDSSGLVLCEGCSWNSDDLRIFNSGDNGIAALRFQDTADAILSCTSIVGGPQTDDGDGVKFDGVTGRTKVTDLSIRYCGGTAISSVTGTAMGPATFERGKIERAGKAVMAAGETIISIAPGTWDSVVFKTILFADPTSSTTDYIFQSQGTQTIVNGIALRGQVQGGVIQGNASDDAQLWSFLARQIDTTLVGSGKTWLGSWLRFGDIWDVTLGIPDNVGMMGSSGLNTVSVQISDSVFGNMTTTSNFLIYGWDGAGTTLQNNAYYNVDSSNVACTNGTGCAIVHLQANAANTNTPVIERQTFAWDQDTAWTKAVESNDVASYADINFGGNAVINMANDTADAAVYGFDLDAEVAASATYRAGRSNNCVSSVVASGGGTASATYVDDFASYPSPKPILGTAASIEKGTTAFDPNSTLVRAECGTSTGAQKPGIMVGNELLYEYMGMDIPQRKPLVRYEEGGP